MRVLIAPNAFKGCLTAAEAARAMAAGVRRASPRTVVDLMPVSDGGDGLMEVLLGARRGERARLTVTGPLGERRRARYAWFERGKTAVIEMAQASGIAGIDRGRLDPLGATSYGTGELLRHALRRGARRILVGMGGSAANDGGAGMAAAMGARLLDRDGRPISPGAASLLRLSRIDATLMEPTRGVEILALSDVANPLLGPLGSARIYGPQKGASPAQVRVLEDALRRYCLRIERDLGKNVARLSGAGAAGGLGAGLAAFVGARIVPGASWVLRELGSGRRLRLADLVLSGEGSLDEQSFFGKAPIALARQAAKAGVPCLLICGRVEPGLEGRLGRSGVRAARALSRPGEDPSLAMRRARARLLSASAQALRTFAAAGVLCASAAVSARAGAGEAASGRGGLPTSVSAVSAPDPFEEIDRLYRHRNKDGNLDRSQELLRARLKDDPGDVRALWRQARGWVRSGELKDGKKERLRLFLEAERALRRCLEADPRIAEAHFWLGVAMGRRGQTRGMLRSLFLAAPIKREMRAVLALDPRHGGAHHVLGEMFRQLPPFAGGSKTGAVEELEKALASEPDHTAHYTALARACLESGERDKARGALEGIFKVKEPMDPAGYENDLRDARDMLKKLGASGN